MGTAAISSTSLPVKRPALDLSLPVILPLPIDPVYVDAAVGDRVWWDRNGNGLQDPNEDGMNGVQVRLFDHTGQLVSSTVTADNSLGEAGYYSFEDIDYPISIGPTTVPALPPTYTIEVTPPEGFAFTQQDADRVDYFLGESFRDSDADPRTGQIHTSLLNFLGLSGAKQTNWDAGLVRIDDLEDDAIEVIEVDAALGDRVWIDANGNGLQDRGNGPLRPGEVGLNGVEVKLLTLDGELVAETVTTNGPADAPGYYMFEDIDFSLLIGDNIRSDLPQYLIEFEAPRGYSFTQKDADPARYLVGESPFDSDVDPETGRAETGFLYPLGLPGAQIFTLDAGLVPNHAPIDNQGAIGDFIWLDSNKNGLQDADESGINGIAVRLFNPEGEVLAETVTADNSNGDAGFYRFDGLQAATLGLAGQPYYRSGERYTVEVELPENYIFTLSNADPIRLIDSESALDSDVDRTTGQFVTWELTDFIGGSSSVQLNWDIGLIAIDRAVMGDPGADQLGGSQHADHMQGDDGHDQIRGHGGDDIVFGGNGNDWLFGQGGSDLLVGDDGNDWLHGSSGWESQALEVDTLQGGDGSDMFLLGNKDHSFYSNGGANDRAIIVDFVAGDDQIQLHGSIGDYRIETTLFESSIFQGSELIATVNQSGFGPPLELTQDVTFIG